MLLRYLSIIGAVLAAPLLSFGQSAVTEFNNSLVRARIMGGGRIGSHPTAGTIGYFIPSGDTTSPLYSSGLWFGGTTLDGQQRAFGHLYGDPAFFSTGPLTVDGSAELAAGTAEDYDRFWTVTRAQVENHIAYYDCLSDPECDIDVAFPGGYSTPNAIVQWPAMGDVQAGQAIYLAPFIDRDADGVYDPNVGDHPCMPGDLAIYHIFNDQGSAQPTGGAMGLEVHMTIFGYWGYNGIDVGRTLFTHYRIINRSSAAYTNFRIGAFADFDLGCYSDDRIATDVERNLLYIYNASDNDANCASPGYGEQPPAFGVQVLKGPLMDPDGTDNTDTPLIPAFNGTGFNDGAIDNERHGLSATMYYNGTGVPGSGDPTNLAQYDNYLRGLWANGVPLTYGDNGYGGVTNAAFAFPGTSDPNGVGTGGVPQAPWTDGTANDRKGIASMGPITLEPGAEQEILVAYIYARATTGGAQESVAALKLASDEVAAFAMITPGLMDGSLPCMSLGTGIDGLFTRTTEPRIYPNPTQDILNIRVPKFSDRTAISILDDKGSIVMQGSLTGPSTTFDVRALTPGVYTIRMIANSNASVGRFVKH